MPQVTALAAAQTAADSSDITVASGGVATLSLFTSPQVDVPVNVSLPIYLRLPGGQLKAVTALGWRNFSTYVIDAPGVYFVRREDISAYGVNIGVAVDQ